MEQKADYELTYLPEKYGRLGPLAWLLDYYLGNLRSKYDAWIDGGKPVLDKVVADRLGTTEDIIEDWRWFLVHEGLIRQHKVKEGGWLISPNPNYADLLEDWMAAWRRLRYLREALWW